MAELMTLELHYPTNWAYEGEVDVLYSDGSGELSYGHRPALALGPWPLTLNPEPDPWTPWCPHGELQSHDGCTHLLRLLHLTGEMSYGKLAQGQTMSRDTYPGHRWVVREAASRELTRARTRTPTRIRARARTRARTRTRTRRHRASCS